MYVIVGVLGLVQLCKTLFKVNHTGLQFVYWKVIKYQMPLACFINTITFVLTPKSPSGSQQVNCLTLTDQ